MYIRFSFNSGTNAPLLAQTSATLPYTLLKASADINAPASETTSIGGSNQVINIKPVASFSLDATLLDGENADEFTNSSFSIAELVIKT